MFYKIKKIYYPFTINQIKNDIAYKWVILFYTLGGAIYVIANMFLWNAIFKNSDSQLINGFHVNEMIYYIFLTFIISNIVKNYSSNMIGKQILDGSISMNLIKPMSFQGFLFFSSLGNLITSFLTTVIPYSIIFYLTIFNSLNIQLPTIGNFLLTIASITLGFITIYFFEMCFGFLGFYTQYLWGLFQIKEALFLFLSGALIPFTFLPEIAEKILTFSPFATIGYVPALLLMGKFSTDMMLKVLISQVIWLILFAILSMLVWKHATKRLVILGG